MNRARGTVVAVLAGVLSTLVHLVAEAGGTRTSRASLGVASWLVSLGVVLATMAAAGCGGKFSRSDAAEAEGRSGSLQGIRDIDGHELRVAEMAMIAGPSGDSDYQIDRTEVTRGQYEDWLATNPPLPAESDAVCGWKSSASYLQDADCMALPEVCQGSGCDDYPVVCVDFCDARAYCAAVGKRLCGKLGGGSHLASSDAADQSQWYWACSSGGARAFPYGERFEPTVCNAFDCGGTNHDAALPVATLGTCQSSLTGYGGVYDQSGNVWEWEDSCYDTVNAGPACGVRGGAFNSYSSSSYTGCDADGGACASRGGRRVDDRDSDLGFRCCSG